MTDYLMERPVLLGALLLGLLVAMVAEYVVKKRRGTWVPVRRRPFRGNEPVRWLVVVLFVVVSAAGGWWTVLAVQDEYPGGVLVGLFMTVFGAWLVWSGASIGRDVTAEERASTTWRRPAMAWWVAAQGVGLTVLGLAMIVVGAVRQAPVWIYALSLALVLAGALCTWGGLRLRVPDLREVAARNAKTPRVPDRGH